MKKQHNHKSSYSLSRNGSFDVLEELEKTKFEIASVFSPIGSKCSSPLFENRAKPIRVKESPYGKLPAISIHRNPMSMISGREISSEWKKKYQHVNKSRLHQWAVAKSIIDRNINLNRAELFLENHGIRFSHYYSNSNV
ncbi:unnamed protein product [Blepharisma stoltei]|uniref:Uncharacterized protein n=1 Tax=Blepharisma stoltei TaxID=1481888 RepID=A0AAU9KHC3_9CILI|nr:unnamed protein product [Blepharisma stoltei]